MWVPPYFVQEIVANANYSRMCPENRHASLAVSVQNDQYQSRKLLRSYLEAVNYPLNKFADDQAITEYDATILRYIQPANRPEVQQNLLLPGGRAQVEIRQRSVTDGGEPCRNSRKRQKEKLECGVEGLFLLCTPTSSMGVTTFTIDQVGKKFRLPIPSASSVRHFVYYYRYPEGRL